MAIIDPFPDGAVLDPETTYTLTGRCGDFQDGKPFCRARWTMTSAPVGGTIIFDDPESEVTDFEVSIKGEYKVTLCCYHGDCE